MSQEFFSIEKLPAPKERHWAFYFKPTSACNLNCSFCYNPKQPPSSEFFSQLSGREAFILLDELALSHIARGRGDNVHFIWHGGEFTILALEWLDTFMEALRTAYPCMPVSGMSNLQSPGFIEKFNVLNKHRVGLSTSRNQFVSTPEWHDNLQYCIQKQGQIHFNTVFDLDTTEPFLDSSERFIETLLAMDVDLTRFCIKFERYFPPEEATEFVDRNFYQLTSQLYSTLFQRILNSPEEIRRYMTMIYPHLCLEFCRRYERKMLLRGFFCGAACYRDMLVIDQELKVGLCTKAMNQTLIGTLSTEISLNDLLHSQEYYNLIERILQVDCDLDSCEYAGFCHGGCPYLPTFDKSGECANSKNILLLLQSLSDEDFDTLLDAHPWSTLLRQHSIAL